jgi:antitoxin component YwqK of YwqJK toxin-antitoxin module
MKHVRNILLLWLLAQGVRGQEGWPLLNYFETDSMARPGYSSIREETTKIQISKNRELREIVIVEKYYNEAGQLSGEERTTNGNVPTRLVFEYDSLSGRLLHISETGQWGTNDAFARYDEAGRLLETVFCTSKKPCRSRHYVYDDDNIERMYVPRQTIQLNFDKDKPGTLFGISAHNRETDELVRERFFDPEGKLEEIRQYSNGKFSVGWIFEYDASGRKTKVWVYNDTEKVPASEFEYDNGLALPRSEKIYAWVAGNKIMPYGESGSETVVMTRDARNRLIRTECVQSNSSTIREYTYNEY